VSSSKKVKASKGEREMAKIAKEEWNFYKDKFAGEIDPLIQKTMDSERGLGGEVRQATEAVSDAFEGQRAKSVSAGLQAGVNPNSGKFKTAISKFDTAKASQMGNSVATTQQAHEAEYVSGVQDLIASGRGIASGAQQGVAMAGNMQNQANIADLQARQAASQAWGSAAGTVAGMGIGAYGQKHGWFDPSDKAGDV
jgi:hypothetical protein